VKAGIDQDALIEMFASASAKQGEQLRESVRQATLGALQGRELSLKNIKDVLNTVTKAATAGAAQSTLPAVDIENLLNSAVAGMDDALLKAVDANRVALQQFVEQGVGLQEKQIKKAVSDLEKFEDTLIGVVKKSAEAASTAEQLAEQMQSAMRDTRAASLKAAQALAQSYSALVSGVLIGMSEALQQGSTAPGAKTRRK
jgi:hypothetical protein